MQAPCFSYKSRLVDSVGALMMSLTLLAPRVEPNRTGEKTVNIMMPNDILLYL